MYLFVQAASNSLVKKRLCGLEFVRANNRNIALLLDESTDVSNRSQLVVHVQYVLFGEFHTFFGKLIQLTTSMSAAKIDEAVRGYLQNGMCLWNVVLQFFEC